MGEAFEAFEDSLLDECMGLDPEEEAAALEELEKQERKQRRLQRKQKKSK